MLISKKYKNSGYTIIEVLFASGVLLFVIVALLDVLVNSSFSTDMVSSRAAAANACQAKLEEISGNVTNIAAYNGAAFNVTGLEPGAVTQGFINVTQVAGTTDLFDVTVGLNWQNRYRPQNRTEQFSYNLTTTFVR
ncbi:MAG: hypothetical protein AAB089_01315 [Nitrospirota bacterium]